MFSWPRLFVGEYVEEQAERPHVERDEDERPFHHGRLGISGELVVRDVGGRDDCYNEPAEQKIIVGKGDHGCSNALFVTKPSHRVFVPF